MSLDGNSILLRKAKNQQLNINNKDTKKGRSSSFSKLQSVGLSIMASVSRRRSKKHEKPTPKPATQQQQQKPQPNKEPLRSPTPIIMLKPSLSARPFSQFYFPSLKEDEEELKREALERRQTSLPPSLQKQQQIKNRQLKRHSIAIDFPDRQTAYQRRNTSASSSSSSSSTVSAQSSSNSSSRSSSLKTIRLLDDFIPEENDEELLRGVQSDITFSCSSIAPKKDNLLRSTSQNKEKRLTGVVNVARARSVLGFESLRSKETRAIHVWKNTMSQLVSEESTVDKSDLYKIITHPALTPDNPLERQRFVRQLASSSPTSPKHVAMMKFILNELVETEKSYNQLLTLIQQRYMQPMVAASQSKDPLVKSTDIPILFNQLPELVQLSDNLLDSFKSSNDVGRIFRSFESSFVVFLKYAMHYRSNTKTIKRACSNVLFIKIDQESLSRRDTNRLGMSDYLIAPIQRVPRYCLLIKDLQKYIHPLDAQYTDLDLALKMLTGLAVAMDYAQQNKAPPPARSSVGTL